MSLKNITNNYATRVNVMPVNFTVLRDIIFNSMKSCVGKSSKFNVIFTLIDCKSFKKIIAYYVNSNRKGLHFNSNK